MSAAMLNDSLDMDLQNAAGLPGVKFADASESTDTHLVAAVLAGDERAFEEIFNRYRRLVAGSVGRFFREKTDIEEFAQQTFTKAYLSLAKFQGIEDSSLAPWITRISINVCYDEFRRRQRRSESLSASLSDGEIDHLESMIDARAVSAEDKIVREQLTEKILASLSPKDRIAVTMVYSEDFTIDEAAGALGMSSSSLKSRLYRCRNQLKKRFGYLFR
jgi:RNA polymerase sigma-70 factor (ECF subfamily)